MVKAGHQEKISFHAFLLLVGVFVSFVYFLWPPPPYYIGSPVALPQTYVVTLSESSPVFQQNIYHNQIGISKIETNDTYVSLLLRDSDEVFFNCSNIIALSEYSIEVPRYGPTDDWWFEVRRQNQDASVNITVYYIAQAVVMTSVLIPPFWTPFVGIALSGFAIYRLVNTPHSNETRKKLAVIIFLVIIGPLCCYPFLFGISRGQFTPHTVSINLPDDIYTLQLNATCPNSSIDISSLYPAEESGVSFRIHSIIPSEFPVQLSVTKNDTYLMILEQESLENDWSILLPAENNSSIIFGIDGLGAELEVAFSVETTYRTTVVDQDITFPAVLGILGTGAIIIGLIQAIRVEQEYSGRHVRN